MDFLQGLMLGVVAGVWFLIYRFWHEVDIYISLEEGDAPPRTLFEMRECNKAMLEERGRAYVSCKH